MPPRPRDNDDERLARIEMILQELRITSEDLCEAATQARKRAATRCLEARALIHDVREARAQRADKKR